MKKLYRGITIFLDYQTSINDWVDLGTKEDKPSTSNLKKFIPMSLTCKRELSAVLDQRGPPLLSGHTQGP